MKNSGMTLMEVLAALLVLTLLVTAMGTSLDLMGRLETSSRFAAESDTLAATIQTTLADVLGFGENVEILGDSPVFTNREFGIQKGSLCLEEGKLCIRDTEIRPLTGMGIYGDLTITSLKIQYLPPDQPGTITRLDGTTCADIPGGLFYVTFRIENATGLTRDYETAIRQVNP